MPTSTLSIHKVKELLTKIKVSALAINFWPILSQNPKQLSWLKKPQTGPTLMQCFYVFLTAIWLPHGQLWAIVEGKASPTRF